jgi:hypothetical protein
MCALPSGAEAPQALPLGAETAPLSFSKATFFLLETASRRLWVPAGWPGGRLRRIRGSAAESAPSQSERGHIERFSRGPGPLQPGTHVAPCLQLAKADAFSPPIQPTYCPLYATF